MQTEVASKGTSLHECILVMLSGAMICIVAAATFTYAPELDIAASMFFFTPSGEFALSQSPTWRFARQVLFAGLTCFYVTVAAGFVAAWWTARPMLGFKFREWAFLAATATLGPWVLVNLVLKAHWGRWRPHQVEPFGGTATFTPPLSLSGDCFGNCSFVSGEVAACIMSVMAMALITPSRLRTRLYIVAVVMGGCVVIMRVGQGAHFLSDSLLAWGLMMALAGALRALFITKYVHNL